MGLRPLIPALLLIIVPASPAAFVYETASEFLTAGDFNGDGLTDAVVLDKPTGNARVGYADSNGALTWSAPFVTGVADATSFTSGRFLAGDRDAIAVTSPELNRIHLVNLSTPDNAPPPIVMRPAHEGITMLVGLEAPYGTIESPGWVATGAHDPGLTLLDLFAFLGDGLTSFQDQIAAEGELSTGNSFRRSATDVTLVAAMLRGSNDTFVAWSYTNTFAPVLSRPGLAPGTRYAVGVFNHEPHPRLLFYVPGQSNVIVQPLIDSVGGIDFDAATVNALAAPVRNVYVVEEDGDGLAMIQFGDGIEGARLPAGSGTLQTAYRFGAGAGQAPAGLVPLGPNRFVLLTAPSNSTASATARVFTRSGTNYTETSSNALPAVTAHGTRANVWLFASEPFVNAQPGFVASLNGGDWIESVSGLPGAVNVVRENDQGVDQGLGAPATQSLGPAPAYAGYGLPNQVHSAISIFSYSAPRAAEPVFITLSPPPGRYDSAINVSFQSQDASDEVYYRLGATDTYQFYAGPFVLATNAVVQYFGVALSGDRSSTLSAQYTFANDAGPIPSLVSTNVSGGTNQPPGAGTNRVFLSVNGTIFYGRRSANNEGTLWAINLDGSGETYLTTGARPRVTLDGRWMAFEREGSPFLARGNVWKRDLQSGLETRLFVNPDAITGYDWEPDGASLLTDYACGISDLSADGSGTLAPVVAADCYDDAPRRNPVDGRIAFHNLNPNTAVSGLYLTTASGGDRGKIPVPVSGAAWPNWSPDGAQLSLVNWKGDQVLNNGPDLFVVNPDGTGFHQITGLTGANGFPNGAIWSPDGGALIAAGTLFGTNGLWVIPLTPDRSACAAPPIRLPTAPGDAIDFVGSIVAARPPPGLSVRIEGDEVVVFWRADAGDFALETSSSLTPGSWTPVTKPYLRAGATFEYRVPATSQLPTQFFRLRWP